MMMPPSLKPYAAWVTDLTDRYRFNPFTRTAAHIIGLQLLLALIMVGIFAWGIQSAQNATIGSVNQHIAEAILHGTSTTDSLPQDIDAVRNRTFGYVFLGLVLLNALFGFLLARFALKPTRDALQFQKRFIGNVAHEIRTPLAIIKTGTEVALFDPTLPAGIRSTLEDTVGELDRISETINNLLSFNTLMRPERMPAEKVDLGAIAEAVAQRHQALARSRDIALSVEIGAMHEAHGNATALDQIVSNLVKNALNYTPAGQGGRVQVEIGASEEPGKVMLTVSDTGIGIEQKDLYHIFEPFYRGDTSRARGVGTGTSGLGLAIVNEIVRLHKGSITIRSAVGQGTTIRILLPSGGPSPLPNPLLTDAEEKEVNEMAIDFS